MCKALSLVEHIEMGDSVLEELPSIAPFDGIYMLHRIAQRPQVKHCLIIQSWLNLRTSIKWGRVEVGEKKNWIKYKSKRCIETEFGWKIFICYTNMMQLPNGNNGEIQVELHAVFTSLARFVFSFLSPDFFSFCVFAYASFRVIFFCPSLPLFLYYFRIFFFLHSDISAL